MMQSNYKKLFSNLNQAEPPHQLYLNIISRIELETARTARTRFILFSAVTLAALIAVIPAFQYALQEFTRSGFSQYLSLIFSDGGTMLAYWQEFTLTLAESLPIFGPALFLSVIFILLGSLKLTMENMGAAFGHHKLINA